MEKLLEHLAETCGCRSYSGRGMYGKKCIAFDCEPKELFNEILYYLSNKDEVDQILHEFIQEFIMDMKEDHLGMGKIIYFPKYSPIK